MGVLKMRLLNIPRHRNILSDPDDDGYKLMLLCPSVASSQDLTEVERAALDEEGVQLVSHVVELGFE